MNCQINSEKSRTFENKERTKESEIPYLVLLVLLMNCNVICNFAHFNIS